MLEKRHRTLMTDSGKEQTGEEVCKWIPKKRHEVLKAKYKCLKKLFQIYDASVIGILPEAYASPEKKDKRRHSRRKRTHKARADASAGTDVSCGTVIMPVEKRSITTSVIRDLKLQYTSTSTPEPLIRRDKFTQDSKYDLSIMTSEKECECTQTSEIMQLPFLITKEARPKPTRFQLFLQRILGIRRERPSVVSPNRVYAASDNNISNRYEKRRRRGLRFRRLPNTKKVHSETALRDSRSPVILTYVQTVQKNCLKDTTPRQCPIVGCKMIFYGIINYNDHLNLCHFTDRKFFCHYCHEGFVKERDKLVHENEHLGITKLNSNLISIQNSSSNPKVASVTQTDPLPKDVNEEKLKKIVSFFDKIEDPEEILAELKKSRHSDVNVTRCSSKTDAAICGTTKYMTSRKSSCERLRKVDRKSVSSVAPEPESEHPIASSIKCQVCGQRFDQVQRLNLHISAEHRFREKYSKCQTRNESPARQHHQLRNEDLESSRSYITIPPVDTSSDLTDSVSDEKSSRSQSCDPSTNIIYYSSLESVKKPSAVYELAKRVRNGFNNYKWEPGTKAVHA